MRTYIDVLPGMAERAPLLVLAHDGFRLEGYLYQPRRSGVELLAQAQSQAVSFAAAVADIVGQLPQRPRRAVLATASATLALLELPVDSDRPYPAQEMLNLVRWEMEPLLAEQIRAWAFGNLLFGRGHLAGNDIERLLAEQAALRSDAHAPRLGELALASQLVKREQIEECVALQAQLLSLSEQVVCAWSPSPIASRPDGHSLWLAAAMDLAVQGRWVAACEKLGMQLEAIVPLTGASLPALSDQTGLMLETQQAGSTLFRLANGLPQELASQLHEYREAQAVCETLLTEKLTPDDRSVHIVGFTDHATTLAASLGERLHRPFATPDAPHAGRFALAAHGAQSVLKKGAALLPKLPGSEPPPPPLKRPQTWVALTTVALLLLAGGYEATAFVRKQAKMSDIRALIAQKEQLAQRNSMIEVGTQRANAARAELAKVLAQSALVHAEVDFYERELGGRTAFADAVLNALPQTVGAEIRIESIAESAWFELELSAWSLSQAAGYRFARDLTDALETWHFVVGTVDIHEQAGSAGRPGYAVKFTLSRAQPASGEAAPASATAGGAQ